MQKTIAHFFLHLNSHKLDMTQNHVTKVFKGKVPYHEPKKCYHGMKDL